ncbi:glycosyl transferases group 1 family protein [Methyloversatilis sp. RAC08]|uniref:glycosyltransferase family 4 protein n=1 Tax=Methyloversatilis sp. RAC08 TaxID=1842540 RepID=UPI00083CC584|nr:glycosyltransferase family 4 protein [Methyloversatilis sp. RAC08]AOF82685.1 glycosyl transferases group 1 family protein [Methyloversatilis sp. RAC08]
MTALSVALIEPVGSHGGMDYYDCGFAAGLADNGVRCIWYSCDISEVRGARPVTLKRTFQGIWGKSSPVLRGMRYVRGLIATLQDAGRERLNLVHLHFFHVGALEFLSVLFARMGRFGVFVTVHDVEAFKAGARAMWLQKITYGMVSGIVVHNEVSRTELLNHFPILAPRVSVVPHGSYLGLVPPLVPMQDARRSLNLGASDRVILFFGQIKSVKGLDVLINAFSRIASSDHRYRLVIAGKVWKDDFSLYQRLIEEGGAAERISLNIRYIPDAEIPAFYGAADVVVLPYRKIYQSGVLLMAMSLGTPVVVSDLPGMTAIVEDRRNGLVFSSEDESHLAQVLEGFFAEPALRDTVVHNARQDMQDKFGWTSVAGQLRTFYENKSAGRHQA